MVNRTGKPMRVDPKMVNIVKKYSKERGISDREATREIAERITNKKIKFELNGNKR